MTRLEMESPIMNNVIANNINNSINLIDGLKLRVPERSYKYRCGNFLDLYEQILSFGRIDDYKIGKMVKYFEAKSGKIGLVYDIASETGIETLLGCLRAVIENNLVSSDEKKLELVILDNVPRTQDKSISYLVLDELKDIRFLNGSEKWYKGIVVFDEKFSNNSFTNIDTPISIRSSIHFNKNIITLENYLKLDNNKLFEYNDTVFTQNNLVSAVSSFLSILPSGHFLNEFDVLTVLLNSSEKTFSNIQLVFKVLSVLMTGGKVNLVKISENFDVNIPKNTTILQFNSQSLGRILATGDYQNVKKSFAYRLSKALQNENVFKKTFKTKFSTIRMLLITRSSDQPISSINVSAIQTTFQCRSILETYIPFHSNSAKCLGPIFVTNLLDNRVFNSNVEANVTFCGAIYPSLQFKLLKKESDANKIGELRLRGFTIGIPIKELKKKYFDEIGKDLDGWVTIYGIDGCIGTDTCFWQLNKII
ncbi:hypothetical protein QEN19_001583 [Hanseniaspora menglaensis]